MREKCFAYIGTYTSGNSKGIYTFEMNTKTGELDLIDTSSQIDNPTYEVISSNKKFLYSVAETETFDHKKSGAVASYSIDQASGKLTFFNAQLSGGRAPCHISTNGDGSYANGWC